MNPNDILRAIHTTYCQLTQLELRWSYEVEAVWCGWHRNGFTESDLRVTIDYLNVLYRKNARVLTACIRLHRLIGDTLFFAEMLAEAKKVRRTKEDTAKNDALRSIGREVAPPPDARRFSEVIASKEFQDLVQLKEKLK